MVMAVLISLSPLISQCGPGVDPATTAAIIHVESGGNSLAIHDNTAGNTYRPLDKTEAIAASARLLRAGHSIDLGLMQINSKHITAYRAIDPAIALADLFDPCENITAGTRILADFYRRCHRLSAVPHVTLLKALSAYNTGHPYTGKEYLNKILGAAGSTVRVPYVRDTEKRDAPRREKRSRFADGLTLIDRRSMPAEIRAGPYP